MGKVDIYKKFKSNSNAQDKLSLTKLTFIHGTSYYLSKNRSFKKRLYYLEYHIILQLY
jgi:hypothetical protein